MVIKRIHVRKFNPKSKPRNIWKELTTWNSLIKDKIYRNLCERPSRRCLYEQKRNRQYPGRHYFLKRIQQCRIKLQKTSISVIQHLQYLFKLRLKSFLKHTRSLKGNVENLESHPVSTPSTLLTSRNTDDYTCIQGTSESQKFKMMGKTHNIINHRDLWARGHYSYQQTVSLFQNVWCW